MSIMLNSLWSCFPVLLAQRSNPDPSAEAASGVMGLSCCFIFVVLPLLFVAINIAILFWVAKDAKSRGMDGAMWLFLIFFTGVIGLAIYIFSRPQGLLTQCHNCGNNRMETSIKCPQCGAGQGHQVERDEEDEDEDIPNGRERQRPVAQRPVAQRPPAPSSRPDKSVITCSHCGARLRLPTPSPAFGQEFKCPTCHKTIKAD